MHDYLPLAYRNPAEAEYIAFLWETFETNYQHGNYQFALLAYHMLCMSSVYVTVWQIRLAQPEAFAHALLFQPEAQTLRAATSPFTFSKISERGILKFLHLIGCDEGQVNRLGGLVAERNHMAHANGNIFCRSQAAADGKIENILARMHDVQAKMAPLLHASFERFLAANVRAEHWEYAAAEDQVRDAFVQPYYLSPQDVAACLQHPAQAASDNHVAGRLHAALRTCLPDTEHLLSPV
jgi:hypothetical protein